MLSGPVSGTVVARKCSAVPRTGPSALVSFNLVSIDLRRRTHTDLMSAYLGEAAHPSTVSGLLSDIRRSNSRSPIRICRSQSTMPRDVVQLPHRYCPLNGPLKYHLAGLHHEPSALERTTEAVSQGRVVHLSSRE